MNPATFRAFVKEALALQNDPNTPPGYVETKAAVLAKMASAAPSRIGDVAELAGLGTLAAPAAHHLLSKGKKEWSEKNKARAEVAGLGILAAPYAHRLAMRRGLYARAAGAAAKRIPQFLKNA